MPKTPRELADDYLDRVIAHDPMLATSLGLPDGADRLSDFSPAGLDAEADLARSALAALDAQDAQDALPAADDAERRCARLLRERMSASLALHEAGEHLRNVGTLFSPVQQVRGIFLQMPSATEEDWSVIGARLGRVAEALEGYRAGLGEGMRRRLVAGPGQVEAVVAQLRSWGADGGWFTAFAGRGPQAHRELLAA
ncbi:MAG: DUF885 family protein, partial [Kineosporiaceae bacterium]